MPTGGGYISGPLVIPNVVQLRLRWDIGGVRFPNNVLHASNPASVPISTTLCDTITNGINADARATTYQGFLGLTNAFLGIGLKNLDTARQAEFIDTVGGFTGTDTADDLPPSTALVVSLKTAVSGPRGRGRVYMCGLTESSNDSGGHAILGAANAAAGFIQAVSDAVFAVGMALCVANRGHLAYTSPFTGAEVPAEDPGSNDVLSIAVQDLVWDSQRRRKG